MTTNNSVNMGIQENADGGQVKLGITQRFLKWLGADITLTGSGSNTHTFPATSSTLLSNQAGEINALTEKTTLHANDLHVIEDSEDGNAKKKVKHSNVDTGGGGGKWTEKSGSFTYASATTMNAPSDATTWAEKGAKVRWKQGGAYKYGQLAAVASTLLTFIPTADFSVANSAITDVAYSNIENPLGWPDVFNWTPSWTGGTLTPGNATITAKYKVIGKGLIWFDICVMFGSTTSIGGYAEFTLPITHVMPSSYPLLGLGHVQDNGGQLYPIQVMPLSSTTAFFMISNVASTYPTPSNVATNTPITFNNGDMLRGGGIYLW